MSQLVEQMKAEAGDVPYLGEVAYEAFWAVATALGQTAEEHEPFHALVTNAKWAWHAAGIAAVHEVAG